MESQMVNQCSTMIGACLNSAKVINYYPNEELREFGPLLG